MSAKDLLQRRDLTPGQRVYLEHQLTADVDYAETRVWTHRESFEARWKRYCKSEEARLAAYRALTDGEREGLLQMEATCAT